MQNARANGADHFSFMPGLIAGLLLAVLAILAIAFLTKPAEARGEGPLAAHASVEDPARAELLDLPAAAHLRAADSLRRRGWRPISLDAYGDSANALFASSWIRSEGGPWTMIHGLDSAAFSDSLAAWSRQGRRPFLIAAAGEAPAFAAAVAEDTVPGWAAIGLDQDGFRRACDSARKIGGRPAWVEAYGTPGKVRFAGVWRKPHGGAPWNYSLGDDARSLVEKASTFAPVWVRPSRVVPMPGGRLFTLWEEGSIGPWTLHADIPADGIRDTLRVLAARGMHPISLSGPGSPGSAGYTVLAAGRAGPLPRRWSATGPSAPGLEAFDEYVRRLMQTNHVRSGALAMVKDGRLVMARGYTWAEEGYPVTRPNSLFRVASCSKPLTSMAVHRLLKEAGQADGPLSLKEKVLSLVNPGSGAAPADSRFADITVDDLLAHSSGWVRSRENPDPVFNDYPAGSPIRRRLPAYARDFLGYMLGQPLQFAPGSKSSYANFGYFLLGRIIETLPHGAGRSYEDAMSDLVFRPLGLTRPRYGGSLLSDRLPGEVLYHSRYPYLQRGREPGGPAWVPGAYGDFDLKNMEAAGAWVLSAPDYAKVLASFDMGDRNPVLSPEAVRTMLTAPHEPRFLRGWFATRLAPRAGADTAVAKWHNGLYPGTSTLVFHLPGRFSFALFLNRDLAPQLSGEVQGREMARIADRIGKWPETDHFPAMGIQSFDLQQVAERSEEDPGRGHYITAAPR